MRKTPTGRYFHPETNQIVGQGVQGATPEYEFELSPEEVGAGYRLMLTGPISGTFFIEDEAYDVTDRVVAVKQEHAAALAYEIHKAHHAAGRFLDAPLPASPSHEDVLGASLDELKARETAAPEA